VSRTQKAALSWDENRRRAFHIGLWPALIALAIITIAPAIYLLITSFTPLNLAIPGTRNDFSEPFVNYGYLWTDERFMNSVWVQFKLSSMTVISQMIIGIGLALILNVNEKVFDALRTVFLIPMVLPPIVVAIIWKVLYTPDISPIHRMLAYVGLPIQSLITNPDMALIAIAIAETWEWFPFTMLMVLAALQMVPDDPIEAAKIDGAGYWQTFFHIIYPFIKPTIILAVIFRIIDSFKAFPLIYLLTNGGPGTTTEAVNYYAFVEAFEFSYWGYASSIAVLMVATVFVLSWIIGRLGGS